jgi:S-formylglutathione hydrolase
MSARTDIAIASTADDIAAAQMLFREYADFLKEDLCFQEFEREMATFPAFYQALLLARVDGDPAGAVGLKDLGDGLCEMKRLFVRPQWRGRGLGRGLAERLIAEARRRGRRGMLLDTLPRLNEAIALYKSLGFVATAQYYDNPLQGVIYMALALDVERVSASKSFGGVQAVWRHRSAALSCDMRFSLFTPPAERHGPGPYPTLFWLSGLTCTEENFIIKAGAQRVAAELGLMIVGPDTSPRGEDVPDLDPKTYDFGLGAGFYVDAAQAPWSRFYRMYSYVVEELPSLAARHFPADPSRLGVFGHSMGGHGALTVHLRNPSKFRSCTAFAPIAAPSQSPWGRKAFGHYLGSDESQWAQYDATRLVEEIGPSAAHILIDQGSEDPYLAEQLKPELFIAAAERAGQKATLTMREGYDHSYFFVSTFIENHLRWHARALSE